MKITLTKDVESHHTNPDYVCAVIRFEESDKHFHRDKLDWIPKEKEVLAIVRAVVMMSPKFLNMIEDLVHELIHERRMEKMERRTDRELGVEDFL